MGSAVAEICSGFDVSGSAAVVIKPLTSLLQANRVGWYANPPSDQTFPHADCPRDRASESGEALRRFDRDPGERPGPVFRHIRFRHQLERPAYARSATEQSPPHRRRGDRELSRSDDRYLARPALPIPFPEE